MPQLSAGNTRIETESTRKPRHCSVLVGRDRKPELVCQSQHARILGERNAGDFTHSALAAVSDQLFIKIVPKPWPFRSDRMTMANSSAMLSGSATIRTTFERFGHAGRIAARQDEGHFAAVVDLGKACQLCRRQLSYTAEHSEVHVLGLNAWKNAW